MSTPTTSTWTTTSTRPATSARPTISTRVNRGGAATASSATRKLLTCGVIAGPLYLIVGFAHALTRDGFDLSRHAFSLLSNGPLGWIHITNMIVTGLLVLAGAAGLRRVVRPGQRGAKAPWLIGIYGASLVGAGVFIADPADGFPVGTPDGAPAEVSWHGMLHFVVGGIGFVALIAACFVLARRFSGSGDRGWATFSIGTGVVFFAAFAGIASGGSNATLNTAFLVAVVIAFAWLTATAIRFARQS